MDTHIKFIKLLAFVFFINMLSACEQSESESSSDDDGSTASIIVNRSSVLLTSISETVQLTAFVQNANKDSIDTPIQWKSNKPNDIAVDEFGIVTSHVVLGSATITAYQGKLESTPVSIIVATFAPDVIVIEDSSIVSPPQLKDPLQIPSDENPLIVSLLKTSSVDLGDKLMGNGTDFFGGEVISIQTLDDELLVTLAMLPLSELFDHLSVNEVIKLDNLEKHVNPKVAALYDVKIRADGSIEFSLKPGAKKQVLQNGMAAKASTFQAGAFECLYEVTGNIQPIALNVIPNSFIVDHDIDLIFDYDLDTIGLQKLAIDGVFEAGLHYDIKVLAGFDGFAECEMELFDIQPSLPGVFKFAMPLTIPLSAGFRVDGKMEVVAGAMQTSGSISSSVVMGIECDELACHPLFNADNEADFGFDYQLSTDQQLADSIKLEHSLMPYATVGFKFWGFNFSSYRAGLAETHKIGLPVTLIKDELYEAEYYLSTETGFIPGQKHNLVWDGIKYLGLSKHDAEINVEESLDSKIISRSPLGAKVTVHKEGEWDSNPQTNQLQFEISVVPTTENYYQFPTGASLSVDTYNIKEIVIIRVADPSEFSLSTEEIARVTAQPGQTEFTIDTFGEFETVDPKVHYYAFALTKSGLKIEDASGSSEDVEYVLLGKVTLKNSIELTNVEYVFTSQTYDNLPFTCHPVNILSNHPVHMNGEDIDRSKVRYITYNAATGLAGGSTNSNNSLSIESSAEATEFKLDVMEELVTMVQPQAIGTGTSSSSVVYGFTVLNGPLNCKLTGTVNGGIHATINSSSGINHQFYTNGEEYEYSIVLDEGENSLTLNAQHIVYGEGGGTLNNELHISVLCDAVLTVLNPEPVTNQESVLIEDCIGGSTPNPGGGGSGPL